MRVFAGSVTTARLLAASLLLTTTVAQAQLAKGQCKFLGNIITGGVPADYNTYWNQASPENSGKWSSIQSSVKN
jgi:endo-1,4-beta-xylanase